MDNVIGNQLLWGVSLESLIAAGVIVFVGFASRRVVTYLFKGVLERHSRRTNVRWDDDLVRLLPGPIAALIQIGMWYCAAVLLALPRKPLDIHLFTAQGLEVALAAALVWLLFRLIDVLGSALGRAARRTESRLDDQFVPLLRKTLKVIISVTVGVMVVQELGYSVSSLIASLGVGGFALALAAKDTVANVFGSVVVFTDQPFQVGDWIEVEGVEGTVEEVGFRTTQIRRFDHSSVTMPNATFSAHPIINHSRRPRRRISDEHRADLRHRIATDGEGVGGSSAFVEGPPGARSRFSLRQLYRFRRVELGLATVLFHQHNGVDGFP